jgi:hypothetical protein
MMMEFFLEASLVAALVLLVGTYVDDLLQVRLTHRRMGTASIPDHEPPTRDEIPLRRQKEEPRYEEAA